MVLGLASFMALSLYGRIYLFRLITPLPSNSTNKSVKAYQEHTSLNWVKYADDQASNGESTPVAIAQPVTPVSGEYGLVIPKIGLNAPVLAEVSGENPKEYYQKLKSGVAHQKGTAKPDQTGNTVIFGHSSAVPGVQAGKYAEVFLLLDKLIINDEIKLYYKGKEYLYRVQSVKVVPESTTSILNKSSESILTIYTCWPPGTDIKRLVVVAKRNN